MANAALPNPVRARHCRVACGTPGQEWPGPAFRSLTCGAMDGIDSSFEAALLQIALALEDVIPAKARTQLHGASRLTKSVRRQEDGFPLSRE
jgi:hypothetical protein